MGTLWVRREVAVATELFVNPGLNLYTIPIHEPIKRIYILMVKEAIESEESNEENT